jgi:hypothetical protein
MNFNFSISSRAVLGSIQLPIQLVPGLKRKGRESDHSPPTSAEVNCPLSFDTTGTIEKPLRERSGFISLQKIRRKNWEGNHCIIQTQIPWPESTNELYLPSDRFLSAKSVATFTYRGCRVVSERTAVFSAF